MNALIRRRLCNSTFGLTLATFDGQPAIFYQKAPSDSAFDEVYPHCVFTVDKFSDAVHGVAGLLTADVICRQADPSPETLEKLCRHALEGVFFAPADGEIFALKWQRTDVFQEPASERMPLIVGATVTFEVREFPSAVTASPDPIQALNRWATLWDEKVIVIGATETADIFEPTFERPALYFDAQRTRMTSQQHSSIWLETQANAHIFAPNVASRRAWCNALAQSLMLTRAVRLIDGAPMRLTACEHLFAADEIQGQLQLTFEYAMQKPEPYAHPLVAVATDFDGRIRPCTPFRN